MDPVKWMLTTLYSPLPQEAVDVVQNTDHMRQDVTDLVWYIRNAKAKLKDTKLKDTRLRAGPKRARYN